MRGLGLALLGAALLLAAVPSQAAEEELRAKAEAGDVDAQFELGTRLLLGRGETKKDPAEAALWFARGAEQGDPRAQVNLSAAYEKGRGVEQDDVTAVNWLIQAADRGHPRAMAKLGERFWNGNGVPQSPLLAHMWVSRAASLGSMVGRVRAGEFRPKLSLDELEASQRLGTLQRERTRRMIVRED